MSEAPDPGKPASNSLPALPASAEIAIPGGLPAGLELWCQAPGIDLARGVGNTSNPVQIVPQ